jgi:acylphosphatase
MAALRLRMFGRVQGVGYRAFVVDEARRLGLRGWVRNRGDGSVEAVISGDDAAIAPMIAACQRGPRFSVVERIEQEPCEESGLTASFDIRPTS